MIEIRRILCPIDFSDCSRRALDHAVAIAKWYDVGHHARARLADRPAGRVCAWKRGRAVGEPQSRRARGVADVAQAVRRGRGQPGHPVRLHPRRGRRRRSDCQCRGHAGERSRRHRDARPLRIRAAHAGLGHREGAQKGGLPGALRAAALDGCGTGCHPGSSASCAPWTSPSARYMRSSTPCRWRRRPAAA